MVHYIRVGGGVKIPKVQRALGEKMRNGYARGKVGMQNGAQCRDEIDMQNEGECGYMQCVVDRELEW